MFRRMFRPRLLPKIRLMPRVVPVLKPIRSVSIFGLLMRALFSTNDIENEYVQTDSNSGQDKFEHRAVAESILQRRLEKGEVVHHINGRRYDNRPENLCVMSGRAHEAYHAWYDGVRKKYGVYPRRETQLRKLRETFKGKILSDYSNKWF